MGGSGTWGQVQVPWIVPNPIPRAAFNPQPIRFTALQEKPCCSDPSCLKATVPRLRVLATITKTATSQDWNGVGVGVDSPVRCPAGCGNQLRQYEAT